MAAPKELSRVFDAARRCLDFNAAGINADIVHVHTWYTHMGGILAKLNYGIPLVVTVHSLEPLRPWKKEQLGGGYDFSCWVESIALGMADAVIAVSGDTRKDILRLFDIDPGKITVIPNGIDPAEYSRVNAPDGLKRYGIDANKPYVLFVGRITRQKGIMHLIRAVKYLPPDTQVVLCASSPDTPEIGAEMHAAYQKMKKIRPGLVWINEMVDIPTKRMLYSHAAVFCCPSIYEPFGIINLEAMACETPVVASAVGGITEAVLDGETGILVPVELHNDAKADPVDPEKFSLDLAVAIKKLMGDAALRRKMGQAGRERTIKLFSWDHVARQTCALYKTILKPLA
jgi:glycogen synthase